MMKSIFILLCCLLATTAARAQFIPGSLFERNQGSVIVKALETGTDKPIPYASAYLTAKNDTLITNFTLTDTTGRARIEKVTRGTYILTVEMLGVDKDAIIARLTTYYPQKHTYPEGDIMINAVVISTDEKSGKCTGIKRIYMV